MPDEARWYVVHTYSGYENKVAATILTVVENRKLNDLIFDVNVPTEMVTEIKDSKTKEVERKVFPGYVMIKMIMTDESWHVVRNTRGATGFVGPGSKPVPLTEAEVINLGVEKHEIKVSFQVGDSVRINDGPFDGFIGTVEDISMEKRKVRVVISIFNRETPVELDFDQIATLD